jgi:thiol-disulfide isomerase/thioredoxin
MSSSIRLSTMPLNCLRAALCAFALTMFLQTRDAALSAAEGPARAGVLQIVNGGAVPGDFHPGEQAGRFLWQGESFTRPFDFPVGAVTGVQFPPVTPTPEPHGDFGFEFVGGDTLYGQLIGLGADQAELDVPGLGRLHVRRDSLHRLYRIGQNSTVLYSGPRGLSDWKQKSPADAWKEDGPRPRTKHDDSRIAGDFKLPHTAVVEIELSWQQKPEFVLAVGVDPAAQVDHRQQGFRIETWGDELVAVRESGTQADVVSLAKLTGKADRILLVTYLDQAKGSMQIHGGDGKLIGKIAVAPEKIGPQSGISLTNRHGDLSLERLRIGRWSGLMPGELAADQSRLERTDGGFVNGVLKEFDASTGAFTTETKDGPVKTPLAEVSVIDLAGTGETPARTVTIVTQDGARLSGQLTGVAADHLALSTPVIQEAIRVPRESIRSVGFAPSPDVIKKTGTGRAGRLEFGEHRLPGQLAPAVEDGDGSCVAWLPDGSATSSPLKRGAAGRVVYRDPPPTVAATRVRRTDMAQPQGNFMNAFLKNLANPKAAPAPKPKGQVLTLHLLTGDVIPCSDMTIGEEGVTITTAVVDAKLVPHKLIKAAEILPKAPAPKLKKAKKERLLTLPRLQKSSPPTHLLCAKTGDFLRCRLIDMNDVRVKVEVQLEEIEIPRERVAQIIWFHPEEMEQTVSAPATEPMTPETPAAPDMTPGTRVHVLRRDGNRLTFQADKIDETTISGSSEVLGGTRFELADLDQILFGQSIEAAAATLAYQQWRLRPAMEPLVAQAMEGGEDGPTGTESLLVGKPAPDFELDLLAGGKFKLSEHRDEIVVLDFWATWCGPCMQTMPLVEEAMKEFEGAPVRLVAVNLEEPASEVKSVLDRHKLSMTVALDQDGITARKYEANAIPQTVIVDREGKVHRLYVGGGDAMVDSLKTSLREMLGLKPPAEKPAEAEKPVETTNAGAGT